MGKMTQYIDYMIRDPWWMTKDFCDANYTHFSVGDSEKKFRRSLKLYKKTSLEQPR